MENPENDHNENAQCAEEMRSGRERLRCNANREYIIMPTQRVPEPSRGRAAAAQNGNEDIGESRVGA